jgi:hypothetical protein
MSWGELMINVVVGDNSERSALCIYFWGGIAYDGWAKMKQVI